MFAQRSDEKELIDLGPEYYTVAEYADCMRKLFKVNKLLGFFRSSIRTVKKFPTTRTLLDVGCGDGVFLLNLLNHFPKLIAKGIDINSAAIRLANYELTLRKPSSLISFQQGGIDELSEHSADIVLATLVCHHLQDNELIAFLQQLYSIANKAVIINDLHRHRLAYWLYQLISPILFRNRLITHDGLISIKRSFTRTEWQALLAKSGIKTYKITWCFPFRWRVIIWKK